MDGGDEDKVLPFTLKERRRTDRLERAVMGYADEGGVWVPGVLLQLQSWREEELKHRADDAKEKRLIRERNERWAKRAMSLGQWLLTVIVAQFAVVSGLFQHLWTLYTRGHW